MQIDRLLVVYDPTTDEAEWLNEEDKKAKV